MRKAQWGPARLQASLALPLRLSGKGEAQGRPVGVRLDKQGALLVADDVGITIWHVTPAAKSAAR